MNIKVNTAPNLNCRICDEVKLTRKRTGNGKFSKPIDIFHTLNADILGPMSHTDLITKLKERFPSLSGAIYILIVIDSYSRYCFIRLLKNKSDAADELIKIMNYIRNQFGVSTIKNFHCDGGTEFINTTMKTYFDTNGIQLVYPPANSPNLNGSAERFNRLLLTIIKSITKNA